MKKLDPQTNRRFGTNVRALRTQKGWTQVELAARAGLSEIYVKSLEQGVRGASILTGKKLSKALGCKRDEILKGVWD